MPTYTYLCQNCGHSDTYIRVISDRDMPPLCRECNSQTVRTMTFTGSVWAPTAGGMK